MVSAINVLELNFGTGEKHLVKTALQMHSHVFLTVMNILNLLVLKATLKTPATKSAIRLAPPLSTTILTKEHASTAQIILSAALWLMTLSMLPVVLRDTVSTSQIVYATRHAQPFSIITAVISSVIHAQTKLQAVPDKKTTASSLSKVAVLDIP